MIPTVDVPQGPAKPVLVFLHYFGGAATSWRWLIKELEDEYECHAIDLPGFGGSTPLSDLSIRSMADHVTGYLQWELSGRDCLLIGHSMGGKIAMDVAYGQGRTGQVKQLVLLAPSPPTRERMPDQEKQRMLNHPDRKEAMNTVHYGTVSQLSGDRLQIAIDTQIAADRSTWKWWIEQGMNESIADHAKLIDIPIELIVSSDDPAINEKMTREDTIPNLPVGTNVTWTSGIGHLFQLEDPVWLASLLKQLG